MLTVSCKSPGIRRPLVEDFSVPPPPGLSDEGDGGDSSLRAVIAHVVRHEVSNFQQRQERRRLDRVLSATQIEASLDRSGRVAPGASDEQLQKQEVDPEDAIAAALQAFSDGIYLVAIDGEQQRDLDATVYLTPESKLVFIRLTFLAGA